jgi:predicted nuclease with RNAse H fold
MGIDVSLNRGLDVVVMAADRTIAWARAGVEPEEVEGLLRECEPGVVGIDSPPGPGTEPGKRTRQGERQLRALGVNVFSTPSDHDRYAIPFYDWVRVGARTFEAAARAGYSQQELADEVEHRALEVFPHATDVFLRGCLPPASVRQRMASKRAWRLETLHRAGVDPTGLCVNRNGDPTLDSVDAALAALTGLIALEGDCTSLGFDGEWIVIPGTTDDPLQRCEGGGTP